MHSARVFLALVVWAFCCVPVGATGEGPTLGNEVHGDYLLRLFDSLQLEDGRRVDDEIVIFRDGVIVLLRNVGRQVRIFRADASPDQIGALKRVLVEEAVDTRLGDCNLAEVPRVLNGPSGLRSRRSWFSWFGVAGRRSRHLALGHRESEDSRFSSDCSAEMQSIAEESFGFARSVLAGPTTTKNPDQHYSRSLLFSVRNDLQSDPTCGPYAFDEDVYIFRDGFLLHHFLDSDGGFAYTRAQVPREMLHALHQVLEEEGIAAIDAQCRTWFFLPFAIDGACLDYSWQSRATWHGRNDRSGSIAGDDQTRLACSEPEKSVRRELVRFMSAAVTDDTSVVVTGAFPSP